MPDNPLVTSEEVERLARGLTSPHEPELMDLVRARKLLEAPLAQRETVKRLRDLRAEAIENAEQGQLRLTWLLSELDQLIEGGAA